MITANPARKGAGAHRPRGGVPVARAQTHGARQEVLQRIARALPAFAGARRDGTEAGVQAVSAPRILVVALALAAPGARAEQADSTKPTQIEANRMHADDARRTNTFEGNVVVTRGTLNIRADRIIVRQDAEGNQYATATGNPVRFRQRQDAKPPEAEGIWLEGEAKRVELDEKARKIELFDSARVN